MNAHTKILFLGLSLSSLATPTQASGRKTLISCRDRVSGQGRIDLRLIKEDDGRFFYSATSCRFPVFSGCQDAEYETAGYVMPHDSSGRRFGDGNISIFPASDVGYVFSDAKEKVQLFFRTDKCTVGGEL